jgi:TM2 domain-containing membrane protein YozV
MITLLLALFAGSFGAHRFYSGHILFGVIQLFTLGGCGVWQLIDIIMIVTGKYTDAQGRPLVKS